MRLIRKIFILLVFFSVSQIYSQTGYFGGMKGIELNVNVVPSFRKTHSYDQENNQLVMRARFMHINYNLSFFKYTKRNGELNFGIIYSRIRMHSEGLKVTAENPVSDFDADNGGSKTLSESFLVLEDPRANYLGLEFKRKYYLSGIAPMGVYLGWSLGAGVGFMNQDEYILGNTLEQTEEGVFFDRYNLTNVEKWTYPSTFVNTQTVSFFNTTLSIGRTFCLSDYLLLNIGLKIPFIGMANNNIDRGTGQFLFFQDEIQGIDFEDKEWGLPLSHSIIKHNQLGIDVGVKWHW